MFYSGGPIDHCTYVPGTVYQSGAEIRYNVACTEGMELEHIIMLKKEQVSMDPDVVLEKAPLIVLYINSALCMAKNVNHTKHTRHIPKSMNFGGEW